METTLDFVNGNTRRCLFSMALPLIAAMFLNMAYNLVDSLWIGNLLGETAYAALTNSTPIILILSAIAMGASNGISILLSQAVGAKDTEKTESLIATSLCIALLFSAGITVLLELLLKPLLTFLKTPEETFSMAYSYLAVYVLGYITVFLYCYFTAVLRSFGNSIFQMLAMLLCTLLNTVLDPLFIRRFGFQGAAAATLLSQTLCLVCMLVYLWKKKLFSFHLHLFDPAFIRQFLAKGIPSAFQQSIPAISTSFLTSLISTYGITALAAYGITGKLETILFYPAMALNMVLTAITGQCVGAKRCDRAKDYIKASLLYGGGLLLFLSLFVVLFSGQLSGLFVPGSAASGIVKQYFLIVGAGYVLNTVTNCFLGALNGMGMPFKSMLCMVLYYLIIRMPLAWLLSAAGQGLTGIWAAVLISHCIAAAAAAVVGILQLRSLGALPCPPVYIE